MISGLLIMICLAILNGMACYIGDLLLSGICIVVMGFVYILKT